MKSKFSILCVIAICLSANFKSFSQANTTLSNLTSPTAVNQDLLPNGNNTRNLGSAPNSWRILYIDSSIYLKDTLFISNKGTQNIFMGQLAGYSETTGIDNVCVGFNSLYNDTTGSYNTAVGSYALTNNTSSGNTAIGYRALFFNKPGTDNTATGRYALYENTRGNYNVANGFEALYSNNVGNENTANGSYALYTNTKGYGNTAYGCRALYSNTTNFYNTATGDDALYSNTTGYGNTANGLSALVENTTGYYNTAVGIQALQYNTTGNGNTALGDYAGVDLGSFEVNSTAIGNGAIVEGSNKVFVGNSNVTSIGGWVGWTSLSDGRYKKNIKQDVQGLTFINSLQPITYTIDIDGLDAHYEKGRKYDSGYEKMKVDMKEYADKASKIIYNGFVAQDVEKAAAKLNYNFSGVDKPQTKDGLYGLRYADFVVPLVKAVQELSKQNDSLKNQNANQQQINADLQNQINELKSMIVSSANGNQSTLISSASLSQNIPNPFASSTSISYNLPQYYTSARIIITDKKGVVLKETGLSARGKGNLNVDASTLAAGAYQYSLYVNGKLIDTKQMLLLR